MHDFLAEQEPKGYSIEPENLPPLEDYILGWAEYFGLLPEADGEVAVAESSAYGATIRDCLYAQRQRAAQPDAAPVAQTATFVNGLEVAGPGPEVTDSYKAKVQLASGSIEPKYRRVVEGH